MAVVAAECAVAERRVEMGEDLITRAHLYLAQPVEVEHAGTPAASAGSASRAEHHWGACVQQVKASLLKDFDHGELE